MLRLIHVCLMSLIAGIAFAQPNPDTLWTRTLTDSVNQIGFDIVQTPDGGYVVAGEIAAENRTAFGLLKLTATGELEWRHNYGPTSQTWAMKVARTADGGFVVGGTVGINGTNYAFLVRTDDTGDTLWTRFPDVSWTSVWGMCETASGGFVVGGRSVSTEGRGEAGLLEVNSTGETLWSHAYPQLQVSTGGTIVRTQDGGYAMTSQARESDQSSTSAWLIKTNATGDVLWLRHFGSASGGFAYGLTVTSDGGLVVTGFLWSYGGHDGLFAGKTSQNGDSLWGRIVTETEGGCGYDVIPTADGGCVIGGDGTDHMAAVRLDEAGATRWVRTFPFGGISAARGICSTSDGGYALSGWALTTSGIPSTLYIVKTGPDQSNGMDDHFILHPSAFILSCYPNPFNPVTTISLALPHESLVKLLVFDLTGRRVRTLADQRFSAGEHQVRFDGTGLASGVYVIRFDAGDFVRTQKVVLMK